MKKKKDFTFYEKEKPSLTPVIIAVRVMIAGVMLLMAYLIYQYATADDEPPVRATPVFVNADETDEQDDPAEDGTVSGDPPPPSMTRATTTPPPVLN